MARDKENRHPSSPRGGLADAVAETDAPTLSIVIASWNSQGDLRDCLASLREHTASASYELIVVDNASSDGTPEMLRRSFPDVRLIENAKNEGFARACNQGMAAARGRFVLLLNSDTYVMDDVIGRAVTELIARPEIGMLGCELRFPDGRHQYSAERALSVRRSLVENLWLYKLVPPAKRDEMLLGGYWGGDREVEADWLCGAFMLLRSELFEASGGFDRRFFMYGEDSEWCMRLRRLGYRILYTPRPGVVIHRGAVSSDRAWSDDERLRLCYRGGLQAYEILNGRARTMLFRAAELFGAAVRWSAYRVATALRRNEYFSRQAERYAWLVRFYASPVREPAQERVHPSD